MFTCPLDDERELRLLEERDVDELYEAIERNRDYLAAWMPWPRGQTRAGTLEFIEASRRQFADNDGFSAAIVDRGRIVGTIGFHAVSWADRSTSIGYWLDEREQGRGTMTRAVAALVDHAFDRWALNRVEIRVAVDNARSRAIPERLGFQLEGTLRQAQRVGDYALLAENWRRGGGWPSSEPCAVPGDRAAIGPPRRARGVRAREGVRVHPALSPGRRSRTCRRGCRSIGRSAGARTAAGSRPPPRSRWRSRCGRRVSAGGRGRARRAPLRRRGRARARGRVRRHVRPRGRSGRRAV